MVPPSGLTATPAGLRRNTRLASIGTGGWFASESVAGFVGMRRRIVRVRSLPGMSTYGDKFGCHRRTRRQQGDTEIREAYICIRISCHREFEVFEELGSEMV